MKFKSPIIFLSALVAVVGFLVALYCALKRDIFKCQESKQDEEEGQENCILNRERRTENLEAEENLNSIDQFYAEDLNDDDVIGRRSENCATTETVIDYGNVELMTLSNPTEKSLLVAHDSLQQATDYDCSADDLLSLPEANVTTSFFLSNSKRRSPFRKVLDKINRPRNSQGYTSKKQGLYDTKDIGISESSWGSSFFPPTDEASNGALRGRLQISVKYKEEEMELEIGVRQGSAFLLQGEGKPYWQVCVAVLPHKRNRFKTKYRGTSTPVFKETFSVKEIPVQILEQLGVRFRIYGKQGKTGMKRFYGEVIVNLDCIEENEKILVNWYDVKDRGQK